MEVPVDAPKVGGRPRLERLTNLKDMEVAHDSVDVRGWDVTSIGDEKLGTVRDLVVDLDTMKARYLLVDLDSSGDAAAGDADDAHALVPLDRTRLDIAVRSVRVNVPDATALAKLT
jgi:hypothetical protein